MTIFKWQDILELKFLILIGILLFAPWTRRIIDYNFFLFLILVLMTVILIKLLLQKFQMILILILVSGFLTASLINLRTGFDRELNRMNYKDEIQINGRHQYYAKELGWFFLNKYSLNYYKNYKPMIYKFQRNLFSALDPNLYFFASHPRERGGISEFEKFPSIYLIFFIFGILFCLQTRTAPVFGYLLAASIINGFISPAFEAGPILFYPLVTALITAGVIYAVTLLSFWFKKRY